MTSQQQKMNGAKISKGAKKILLTKPKQMVESVFVSAFTLVNSTIFHQKP